MKNQRYEFEYSSSSTPVAIPAKLGTIENDASGFAGRFDSEDFRGKLILDKLLQLTSGAILDVGAGMCEQAEYLRSHGNEVITCDYAAGHNSLQPAAYDYVGDFNKLKFDRKFDAVLCSHILEHQLNVHEFLRNVVAATADDGYIAIIVPPRKPFIIGGHVSLWNAGLLIYNLVLAGVDCSVECYVKQYDYNVGVIVRNVKNNIDDIDISYDGGDIDNHLSQFFPFPAHDGFNGDIMELNWA